MTSAAVSTLVSPWDTTFTDLVTSAASDLLILSPYITRRPLETLLGIVSRNHREQTLVLRIVTDFSAASVAAEALDVAALLRLLGRIRRTTVTHLPRLHAKIYVADRARAVVTSANLTDGGLSLNREFGLCVQEPSLVARVRNDAEAYADLGGALSYDDLADIAATAADLIALRRRADRELGAGLKAALRAASRRAETRLLRVRAHGKTTHGILADTLVYLLGFGPHATVDLHRRIQNIHPDICDDSIERVIDGVHFGKRWKHYVRTAQQHLKRRGMIMYEQGRWYRTDVMRANTR